MASDPVNTDSLSANQSPKGYGYPSDNKSFLPLAPILPTLRPRAAFAIHLPHRGDDEPFFNPSTPKSLAPDRGSPTRFQARAP